MSLSLVEDTVRGRIADGYPPEVRPHAGAIAVDAVEVCAEQLREHAQRCEGEYRQGLLDAADLLQGT